MATLRTLETLATALVIIASLTPCHAAPIALEDRVAAEWAIEEVSWQHRLWPAANPDPRPPLSTIVGEDVMRARVEDTLRKSTALERFWQRPVTSAMLQAELERIARDTRDAGMLAEIFAALGNDPDLLAETLARRTLTERLLRNWYAYDDRFHGDLRRRARSALAEAGRPAGPGSEHLPVDTTVFWRRAVEHPHPAGPAPAVRELDAAAWTTLRERLATSPGTQRAESAEPRRLLVDRWGPLEETATTFEATAVLSASADEIVVATARWSKTPLDAWWTAVREALPLELPPPAGPHRLPLPGRPGCSEDTWRPLPGSDLPAPSRMTVGVWTGSEVVYLSVGEHPGSRYVPATDTWTRMAPTPALPPSGDWTASLVAVWTGTEVVAVNLAAPDAPAVRGGRYDPASDSWAPIATAGAPTPRLRATAVWTGTEMIVWGGATTPFSQQTLDTGARYDPAGDTWASTSTAGAPSGAGHTAVWTGNEMLVWGNGPGHRYDPASDTWGPMSTDEPVLEHEGHSAVWTGTEMIVWGGGPSDTGGRYDPALDRWRPTATTPGTPSPRAGHSAVWTGAEMIVWGGEAGPGNVLASGGRYDPSTDTWAATSMAGAPPPRSGATEVWTGSEMIVWGGFGAAAFVPAPFEPTGGRYDPSSDTWLPTSNGNGAPSARAFHTATWTGTEMIVWGGGPQAAPEGARYQPATDTWRGMSADRSGAGPRGGHTAVWTGKELIVWGGGNLDALNTGGRYDPLLDTWTGTSVGAGVPGPRELHTAVWTGTEMVVWGGRVQGGASGSGARYRPDSDTWSPVSTAGAPGVRYGHTAVWTGSEMIVWGGYDFDGEALPPGARYDPRRDRWAAMAGQGNGPLPRIFHTAVWTGREMIVWGGGASVPVPRGAHYNPRADRWKATAAPELARSSHTSIWTGREVISFGGYFDRGSRYDPRTAAFGLIAIAGPWPARTDHTAVWTGKEMIVFGGLGNGLDPLTGGLAYCPADFRLGIGEALPGAGHPRGAPFLPARGGR